MRNVQLQEGPVLDRLLHHLAECPEEFLREPRIGQKGEIRVQAVIQDLLAAFGATTAFDTSRFASTKPQARAFLRLVLVSSWLVSNDWFLSSYRRPEQVYHFLATGLYDLAPLVAAEQFVADPDRREELVRLCLLSLGLRPAGETQAQSDDRLKTLNTVERTRVLKDTEEQRKRAKLLREQMKKQAAEEAAAKVSREW